VSISFGEDVSQWGDYGYQELPVLFNGEPTGYKAILRRGKLVKLLGEGYILLPNEYALEIADQAAELVGLEPFKNVSVWGLYRWDREHALVDDPVLPRTMRAVYIIPEGVEKIDGEEVHVGVDIFNSIDGTSSFGAGVFTYRYVCENGVFMGKEILFSIRKAHRKGLQELIHDLKNRLVLVMERAPAVLDAYRQLAEQRVTDRLIEKLKKSRISRKVLPDYITADEVPGEAYHLSQWDLYNDITEAIWHNVKAGMKTKTHQFNVLHQVMEVRI